MKYKHKIKRYIFHQTKNKVFVPFISRTKTLLNINQNKLFTIELPKNLFFLSNILDRHNELICPKK